MSQEEQNFKHKILGFTLTGVWPLRPSLVVVVFVVVIINLVDSVQL